MHTASIVGGFPTFGVPKPQSVSDTDIGHSVVEFSAASRLTLRWTGISGADDRTIALWVKTSPGGGRQTLLAWGDPTNFWSMESSHTQASMLWRRLALAPSGRSISRCGPHFSMIKRFFAQDHCRHRFELPAERAGRRWLSKWFDKCVRRQLAPCGRGLGWGPRGGHFEGCTPARLILCARFASLRVGLPSPNLFARPACPSALHLDLWGLCTLALVPSAPLWDKTGTIRVSQCACGSHVSSRAQIRLYVDGAEDGPPYQDSGRPVINTASVWEIGIGGHPPGGALPRNFFKPGDSPMPFGGPSHERVPDRWPVTDCGTFRPLTSCHSVKQVQGQDVWSEYHGLPSDCWPDLEHF